MDFNSPLRYPGGKGKVSDYFKKVISDNLLYDGIYIEPYAGGASVAFSLLFNEYVSKVIINDIDVSIYAFWHSVINNTDNLVKLINDTTVNEKTWHLQKSIQKSVKDFDLLSIGFSTFFLNRTNRSGIIKAGMIGGNDQTGNWKIDARFNKKELIRRIEKIALYKDKIEIFNVDAVKLIKKLKPKLTTQSLFYFDPPYYVKGKDLYLNFYKHDDHEKIAAEIKLLEKHKWIVTYDNVDSICNLYQPFRKQPFSLNYSAGKASKGEEIMIFSNNLFIPQHELFE